MELLEVGLDLTVSRGSRPGVIDTNAKTVTVGSSRAILARLKGRLNRLGTATKVRTKLLGVDFSCGKRVVRSTQRLRVTRVCARRSRYKQLGRRASGCLVRQVRARPSAMALAFMVL